MNRKSWVPSYSVPTWAQRSKYYLMEFIAGLVGLLATTFLLDRVLFALAHYLNDAQATSSAYDQMNLWAVAALVVALPLTVLFYKRSRFEELSRPGVAATKLRRFFLYSFMLVMLLSFAVFAVTALYSVLLLLFGANETDVLLRQTLPATIAAGLHAYVFRTFMKANTGAHIKEFAFIYSLLGVVLLVAMLVMTSIQARSSLVDEKTSKDLRKVSNAIDSYYTNKGKLPGKLSELSLDAAIIRRGEKHGYSYEKQSSYRYKLCADFKAKGDEQRGRDVELMGAKTTIYPPPPNDSFFVHGKGRQCFDLSAGGRVYPAEGPQQSQSSPAPLSEMLDSGESILY